MYFQLNCVVFLIIKKLSIFIYYFLIIFNNLLHQTLDTLE